VKTVMNERVKVLTETVVACSIYCVCTCTVDEVSQ